MQHSRRQIVGMMVDRPSGSRRAPFTATYPGLSIKRLSYEVMPVILLPKIKDKNTANHFFQCGTPRGWHTIKRIEQISSVDPAIILPPSPPETMST